MNTAKSVTVNFNNFDLAEQSFNKLTLNSLSSSETFVSHSNNALKKATVDAAGNSISLSLPAMSITTLQLKGARGEVVTGTVDEVEARKILQIFPNPVISDKRLSLAINRTGNAELELLDATGNKVKDIYQGKIESVPFKRTEDVSSLSRGAYFLRLNLDGKVITRKVFLF